MKAGTAPSTMANTVNSSMVSGSQDRLSSTGAGLAGPPSPGSILAYFAVTPPGGHLPMILTVLTAAVVSFLVTSALLKFGRGSDDSVEAEAAE